MSLLRSLFRFLGGLYCAITLIALAALFVIAGTLLESATQSHLYAESWTYRNPLFIALLCGFFLNILLSALRRWPFQRRHIPFLITHLGLLMLLSGVFVKNLFGIQGNMLLIEGSGSNTLVLPHTFSLHLEERKQGSSASRHLAQLKLSDLEKQKPQSLQIQDFQDLKLQLFAYAAHTEIKHETWIKSSKGGQKYVDLGMRQRQEIPLQDRSNYQEGQELQGVEHQFLEDGGATWQIFAVVSTNPSSMAREIFVQGTEITLIDSQTGQLIFQGDLKKALQEPIVWEGGQALLELHWDSLESPQIIARVQLKGELQEKIVIPLSGDNALWAENVTTPYFGKTPSIALDLKRAPSLVLIDEGDSKNLWTFDPYGRVFWQQLGGKEESLYTYDGGFGGYAVQMKIPASASISSPKNEQEKAIALFEEQLRQSLADSSRLVPPISLFCNACYQTSLDPALMFVDFLRFWEKGHGWLYSEQIPLNDSLAAIFRVIDWSKVPKADCNGCKWTLQLFQGIEPSLKRGEDVWTFLEQQRWPLLPHLAEAMKEGSGDKTERLLTLLTQQIFAVADQLPEPPEVDNDLMTQARLLSAYLRAYQIHGTTMFPKGGEIPREGFLLECPLKPYYEIAEPQIKWEENQPLITLKAQQGRFVDWITLVYDRSGSGLKWPFLGGSYLARFQPETTKIPYRVRLRNARQINYANSGQPFSYESDLLITDLESGEVAEASLEMNHVYETWDGYRFYLANVTPSSETAAKRVHLVVNHDPAKYWLTYPGALLVALGIALLFWGSATPPRKK